MEKISLLFYINAYTTQTSNEVRDLVIRTHCVDAVEELGMKWCNAEFKQCQQIATHSVNSVPLRHSPTEINNLYHYSPLVSERERRLSLTNYITRTMVDYGA